MTLESALTVLSILVIITGAIRWLLGVYFSQKEKLADQEKSRTDTTLSSLNDTVETHARKIEIATNLMGRTEQDLSYTNKQLTELKLDLKELSRKTEDYTKVVTERVSKLEVISENLRILRTPKK